MYNPNNSSFLSMVISALGNNLIENFTEIVKSEKTYSMLLKHFVKYEFSEEEGDRNITVHGVSLLALR